MRNNLTCTNETYKNLSEKVKKNTAGLKDYQDACEFIKNIKPNDQQECFSKFANDNLANPDDPKTSGIDVLEKYTSNNTVYPGIGPKILSF